MPTNVLVIRPKSLPDTRCPVCGNRECRPWCALNDDPYANGSGE